MVLNNINIKSMSVKEIVSILMPSIIGIYKSIDYLEISRNEFLEIVINVISKTKNKYNGNKPYNEFVKDRVKYLMKKKKNY